MRHVRLPSTSGSILLEGGTAFVPKNITIAKSLKPDAIFPHFANYWFPVGCFGGGPEWARWAALFRRFPSGATLMGRDRPAGFCKPLLSTWLVFALIGGVSRADEAAELRAQVQQLSKRIEELEHQLADTPPTAGDGKIDATPEPSAGRSAIDETAIKKIVADYLKDNPGAGMPPGVQTGYFPGQGFVVRSPPGPCYSNWQDECAIPFELRIRGLLQLGYDFYKVKDSTNHLTGEPVLTQFGDFSQLEVKRARLAFLGTAFTPDLRYCIELEGSTVGLPGLVNVGRPRATPIVTGNNIPGTAVNSVAAVSLYTAYLAYDWRPGGADSSCEAGIYEPTVTAIAGKYRPFFAFEQYLGDGNQQFVEHGMATWFFDADDDNQQVQVGVQLKACEDRLFATLNVSNGNDSATPNLQLDRFPGFNGGLWYDFGGNWNEAHHRWDLYGTTVSDIDYSCAPVARVGTMFNLVPMDRRSIYGAAEESRVEALPGLPGGTSFINLFDGGSSFDPANRTFAMDAFDAYSAEAFFAFKWRGFSLLNDWWVRDLQHFRATKLAGPGDPIVYSIPVTVGTGLGDFLFPKHPVIDFGMLLQVGYFLVPKKLEVAARWSWLRGESGDIFGSGTELGTVFLDGVPVVELRNAFRNFHEADEYTVGINYYWKGEMLKWQTDFGVYQGGNPAAGGRRLAGFIPGVDGWLLRTQFQLWF
jgi:hypothetical protein